MKKHKLEIIISVFNELHPVLKDFFRDALKTEAAPFTAELNACAGLGVILNYTGDSKCIVKTSLSRKNIEIVKSTFSMGNFGTADETKISHDDGKNEYCAYYSESEGGYARMNPPRVSIGVA